MPNVDGIEYPYTPSGIAAAKAAKKAKGTGDLENKGSRKKKKDPNKFVTGGYNITKNLGY